MKVQLPHEGDTWFFVRPADTIDSFKSEMIKEDAQIETVEVFQTLDGKKK